MKKILALVLALVMLLSACANGPVAVTPTESETGSSTESVETDPSQTDATEPKETEPSETEPSQMESSETEAPTTEPVEPPPVYRPDLGMYQPDSAIEMGTGGAIKYFLPQEKSVYDIALLGDGILLFSEAGEDTQLTLCREERDPICITIPVVVACNDGRETRVGPKGVSYYDANANAVVFLDTELQEVRRVELLAENLGTPMVSADWSHIYYFIPSALMCVELETGISRVRKECSFESQYVTGLYFDGAVLECSIYDGGEDQVLYISTESGETLFMSGETPFLKTGEQWYFAEWYGESYQQFLFGNRGGEIKCFTPGTDSTSVAVLPDMKSVVVRNATATGNVMDLYSLEEGTRTASIALEGMPIPWCLVEDLDRELIWFLSDGSTGATGLYCWDYSKSVLDDKTNYTTPYYTSLEPDWSGLAEAKEQANTIAQKHGVQIKIYEDAIGKPPVDFVFTSAHQVPLYQRYLPLLDQALSAYPKDFLKKLGKQSDNNKITICLVSGAYGDNDLGAVSEADGVHYMLDGNHYIALVMNNFFEGTLYHELFHIIDIYVMNRVNIYDWWDDLNPKGFKYDNDYLKNQYREDYKYLEGNNRAFIDMYSMSFAKEDRARIMEYAMQGDNDFYFNSSNMQKKLKTLSEGIRKAFGLEKYKEPLVWEQYLK